MALLGFLFLIFFPLLKYGICTVSKNRSQRKDPDTAGSVVWFSPSTLLDEAHPCSCVTQPHHYQGSK